MSIQTLREFILTPGSRNLNILASEDLITYRDSHPSPYSIRISFLALEVLSRLVCVLSRDHFHTNSKTLMRLRSSLLNKISSFIEDIYPKFNKIINERFEHIQLELYANSPVWDSQISNFLQSEITKNFCRNTVGDILRDNTSFNLSDKGTIYRDEVSLESLQSCVLSTFALGLLSIERQGKMQDYRVIHIERDTCNFISNIFQTVQFLVHECSETKTSSDNLQHVLARAQVEVLNCRTKDKKLRRLAVRLTPSQKRGMTLGLSISAVQHQWWRDIHVEAIKKGFKYKDIQGLTTVQVKGMLQCGLSRHQVEGDWYARAHLNLGQRGVSYEQYAELNLWEARAMEDGFISTRRELKGIASFGEREYNALNQGISLAQLKLDQLGELDRETLLNEANELGVSTDQYLALTRFQQLGVRDLGLSYEQVNHNWFANYHYEAGKRGIAYEQYEGLNDLQAQAFAEGYVTNREDVDYRQFSEYHFQAFQKGVYPSKLRGVGEIKVKIVLCSKYSIEEVLEADKCMRERGLGSLRLQHLKAIRKGVSLRKIAPTETDLHIEAVRLGVFSEKYKRLTRSQQLAMWDGLSYAQVTYE